MFAFAVFGLMLLAATLLAALRRYRDRSTDQGPTRLGLSASSKRGQKPAAA